MSISKALNNNSAFSYVKSNLDSFTHFENSFKDNSFELSSSAILKSLPIENIPLPPLAFTFSRKSFTNSKEEGPCWFPPPTPLPALLTCSWRFFPGYYCFSSSNVLFKNKFQYIYSIHIFFLKFKLFWVYYNNSYNILLLFFRLASLRS